MKEWIEMAEYVPSTGEVLAWAESRGAHTLKEFTRWLAANNGTVAARALRDAAEEWASDPEPVGDTSADYRNWLRDRADRIEGAS